MSDERHPPATADQCQVRSCQCGEGEFGELIKYTLAGYVGGLIVAGILDALGLQKAALGQWLVRTLGGEAESLFEGFFALRQRLLGKGTSMAESYAWGKFLGMTVPWIIDALSRLIGINVYGIEGFYIPFFYAMSDQIGANVAGLVHLKRQTGSWRRTAQSYVRNPVMLASLAVILVVPLGLLGARVLGFSPNTQLLTALEIIAANLCWVPPLIGWLGERRQPGPPPTGHEDA